MSSAKLGGDEYPTNEWSKVTELEVWDRGGTASPIHLIMV